MYKKKMITFFLFFVFFILADKQLQGCWLDPSYQKELYPQAWNEYQKALLHTENMQAYSKRENPNAEYTFSQGYYHIKDAKSYLLEEVGYDLYDEVALHYHLFYLSYKLWYFSIPYNYIHDVEIRMLDSLLSACNIEDTYWYTEAGNEDLFLIFDTNYDWLIQLAKFYYDSTFHSEDTESSFYVSFLCLKRLILFGQRTPWFERQRAKTALELCALIAKNYFKLSKIKNNTNYLNSELYALEAYINLAFCYDDEDILNPFEDTRYVIKDICKYTSYLQERAVSIFYLIDTEAFKKLKQEKMGYESRDLSLQILFRRARISLMEDQTQDAIKYYELAVKFYPGFGEAHAHLGNAYFVNRDYIKASEHFEKALHLGYKMPNIQAISALAASLAQEIL